MREKLRLKRLSKEGALDRARAREPGNTALLKRYKNELAGAKSEVGQGVAGEGGGMGEEGWWRADTGKELCEVSYSAWSGWRCS